MPTITRAARERDRGGLRDDLVAMLVEGEEAWLGDWRDLLVSLAPYHHCAARLALDVPAFFAEAAAAGPASIREHVVEFGRRTDIAPAAWGFRVDEEPDGPRYVIDPSV